jgi:hypothetical protein
MDEAQKDDLELVTLLARHAGLDIPPGRVSQVAAILHAWQADAIVLARRMSERRFDALLPITTFSHGIDDTHDTHDAHSAGAA